MKSNQSSALLYNYLLPLFDRNSTITFRYPFLKYLLHFHYRKEVRKNIWRTYSKPVVKASIRVTDIVYTWLITHGPFFSNAVVRIVNEQSSLPFTKNQRCIWLQIFKSFFEYFIYFTFGAQSDIFQWHLFRYLSTT